MREVGAQGQAQLVDGDRAAKVQRECGVRVAVDAPALVGILAVGAVLKNAVDGVAGGNTASPRVSTLALAWG